MEKLNNMPNKQPKYLYKYLNSQGLTKTLKNLSIKCSHPYSFNDPFDCTPPFHFVNDCTKQCLLQNKYGDTCEGFIKCVAEKCFVTCFSSQPFNILMWGHYTDNYKGGVIKLKRNIFLLKHTKKVHYSNRIPTISSKYCFNNFFGDRDRMLTELLYLSKQSCWEYEKEWRFFYYVQHLQTESNNLDIHTIKDIVRRKKINRLRRFIKNNKIYIPLISDDIVEIYIGYNNDKIDTIKSIMEKKNINAKLYIIKPESNSFKLKKELIT